MKKYPKLVQCDKRGQIVIPKDMRRELKIDEGTGFWLFSITDEGILLKKAKGDELSKEGPVMKRLSEKSGKIGMSQENIESSLKRYKKTKQAGLELVE